MLFPATFSIGDQVRITMKHCPSAVGPELVAAVETGLAPYRVQQLTVVDIPNDDLTTVAWRDPAGNVQEATLPTLQFERDQ
jgi:hypothetical protein